MKSKLYISIAVVIVFIIGLVAIIMRSGSYEPVTNPATHGGTSAPLESLNPNASGSTSAGTTASTEKTYTMAQVAQHKDATSCWAAINGGVYDLTDWINQHPGGPEAILSLCGTDGSAAFNAQHGGQRDPARELAKLKIGILAQ